MEKTWPIISSEYLADRRTVETCLVEIPVGTSSMDKIVVFGFDGHLFVYSGANDICAQYLMDEEEAQRLAAQWISKIEARRAFLQARNIQFLQIMIPEKSSLLPAKAPFPAFAGTPLQRAITASQGHRMDYLDARDVFDDEEALSAFPKANGHLSPSGNLKIFQVALERLGFGAPIIEFGPAQIMRSDLGDHFSGMVFYNRVSQPTSPELWHYQDGMRLLHCVDPDGHLGQQRTWSNANAPIKKRVLAFGNSFFERGGSPTGLSWWFGRWFVLIQISLKSISRTSSSVSRLSGSS
ncbi:hypothetical protein [Caulobacter sp. UNC279MFTsu5.1]|uniref:hypothetical protein n=1 Tax=Caulobacter sp. UNC279MFTsu5.1 TaxID=1502775 RepID=UPI00036F81ED|nr:hypothetical protein [Caulobacter sp. UNC279MFTsu5.1]